MIAAAKATPAASSLFFAIRMMRAELTAFAVFVIAVLCLLCWKYYSTVFGFELSFLLIVSSLFSLIIYIQVLVLNV